MRAVERIFEIGWAAFWLYWIAAAFGSKRGRIQWGREARIRLVIIVVVVALLRFGAFRHHGVHTDPVREAIGLVLFALGLAFAVWARVHLGRNWGSPMTQKDDPELVTSGPYRLVRHPIYSGILLAGAGTAVGLSWWWLIAAGVGAIYFVYAAAVEERFLSAQLPDAYPAYRRTTKMVVPFIL